MIREWVLANGGSISYEMIEIPTVGTLTQFLDTEGNDGAATRSAAALSSGWGRLPWCKARWPQLLAQFSQSAAPGPTTRDVLNRAR